MSNSNAHHNDNPDSPNAPYRCSDLLMQHLCVGGTIFENLSEQELQQADQYLHPLSVATGGKLYTQGELGDTLIYIVKGRFNAETDGNNHGEIGAGTIVGEMAPFIHQARSASITAVEDCEVLVLSAKDFSSLREANHTLAWKLERATLKTLSQRMRVMTDRIKEEMTPNNHSDSKQNRAAAPTLLSRIKACLISSAHNTPSETLRPELALRQCDLFQGEPNEILSALSKLLQNHHYPAKSYLCRQGGTEEKLHFVVSGQVAVEMTLGSTDGSLKIATISRGGVLGLMDLTDHQGSSADCIAETDVATFSLARHTWEELFSQDDQVGSAMRLAVIREFCRILSSANDYVGQQA